jgi:acetyl esterase/lipase
MSWQMRAIAVYVRLTRKPELLTLAAGESRLAKPKGPSTPPAKLTRRCDVTCDTVESFDVYTVRPKNSSVSATIPATVIYLHGGAYVSEIQPPHWTLIGNLATQLGCPVVVPIYGLAPQHHVDEAFTLVHSLLTTLTAAGPTYLVGDSAGGSLALATTQAWLASGGPPPRGLTLMSPWLDATLKNTDINEVEPSDPWLTRPGLAPIAKSWAHQRDLDDPWVSPLFGELTDLPLIDLYIGDRDITMPDCRLLRDRLPADRIRYHEQPGAVHVYPLLPTPEGRTARREFIAHIKTVLH